MIRELDTKAFLDRLRRHMEDLALTCGQAAEKLGVHRTTLLRVLRGDAQVSLDLYLRATAWLGEPVGAFVIDRMVEV